MDILLVNITLDSKKKPYDDTFPFSRSINFGLLSIASYLVTKQYKVGIFDPQSSNSDNPLSELLETVQREQPPIIGLSCISGFGYETFKRFSKEISKSFPQITVIAGGQHHIGELGKTILEECEGVDIVVKGESELTIFGLLENLKNGITIQNIPNIVYRDSNGIVESPMDESLVLGTIPKLNIQLYPNFKTYPAIVEVSRGCPHSCSFCSSNQKKLRIKTAIDIFDEIEFTISAYKSGSGTIYLEAPVFYVSDSELQELIHLRKKSGSNFTWRAETRVEYLIPERIKLLYDAGMRVVDIGLESGSAELLQKMQKTQHPKKYLHTLESAFGYYGLGEPLIR